jgi:hypothetical protein
MIKWFLLSEQKLVFIEQKVAGQNEKLRQKRLEIFYIYKVKNF